MAACAGPLATINREPGQTRKGAAAAVDSGAGVWLVQVATHFPRIHGYSFSSVSVFPDRDKDRLGVRRRIACGGEHGVYDRVTALQLTL